MNPKAHGVYPARCNRTDQGSEEKLLHGPRLAAARLSDELTSEPVQREDVQKEQKLRAVTSEQRVTTCQVVIASSDFFESLFLAAHFRRSLAMYLSFHASTVSMNAWSRASV